MQTRRSLPRLALALAAALAGAPAALAQNPIALPSSSSASCSANDLTCFKMVNTRVDGTGIRGEGGTIGVRAISNNGGTAFYAVGPFNPALFGTGTHDAVYAYTFAPGKVAVKAESSGSGSMGVSATSFESHAVKGVTSGCGSCGAGSVAGVYGVSNNGIGLGVRGDAGTGGTGVWGKAGPAGFGLFGTAETNGKAIYGLNQTGGYAGYFDRNVRVVGTLEHGGLMLNTSDARMKKDIKDLEPSLEHVLALRPVTFKWKSPQGEKGVQIGLIAQEVQKVIPALVHKSGESDTLMVNQLGMLPVVLKAVQEQQQLIQRLEARIATLERGGKMTVGRRAQATRR